MISSTQTNHPLVNIDKVAIPETPLNMACSRLKFAKLRITQPRIAILNSLIARGQPTSIEQIHCDLANGSCDLVTVYRCLGAFEQIGLVRRSFYHNGTSLYTINLGTPNQYHIFCKETDLVENLDESTTVELRRCVETIEENLIKRGYKNVTHVVEFFGVTPTGGRLAQFEPTTVALS